MQTLYPHRDVRNQGKRRRPGPVDGENETATPALVRGVAGAENAAGKCDQAEFVDPLIAIMS